jgi:putative phosphoribosyl transferase
MNYKDRKQAGRLLAGLLKQYAHQKNTLVLGLPRGGVPVAYEIARILALPLDVFIVRKLGLPGHSEYAMGALASGNVVVFNEEIILGLHINQAAIDEVVRVEQEELLRREQVYRGARPYPELTGKNIILVDDGIATGYSMRAALASLVQKKTASIIIAVPVAARSTCEEFSNMGVELVCPMQPIDFYAVGLWYEHFSQTTDEEVIQLLQSRSGG